MNIPDGFGTVVPYLFVKDAETYVDFLKSAFGAVEIGRSVSPDGAIANCQIRIGTTIFMIREAQEYPPSSAALYLYVADADEAMERALKSGAQHEMNVDDMPYGDRQGGIKDISGNIWWISQRMESGGYF